MDLRRKQALGMHMDVYEPIQERQQEISKSEDSDIEKSDVMRAISCDKNIEVEKSGKEIKEHVKSVLLPAMTSELEVEKNNAIEKLKSCGGAPTSDPDPWWTDGLKIDCSFKVYKWEETYVKRCEDGVAHSLSAEHAKEVEGNFSKDEEQAQCRRDYNEIVRNICNIVVDVKACEILNELKDEKKYGLSPKQVVALKFC